MAFELLPEDEWYSQNGATDAPTKQKVSVVAWFDETVSVIFCHTKFALESVLLYLVHVTGLLFSQALVFREQCTNAFSRENPPQSDRGPGSVHRLLLQGVAVTAKYPSRGLVSVYRLSLMGGRFQCLVRSAT